MSEITEISLRELVKEINQIKSDLRTLKNSVSALEKLAGKTRSFI